MFEDRWEISGRLQVVAPLHIGTGESRPCRRLEGRDGEPPPEAACLARDGSGAPIVPATTFKGVLRRLAEDLRGPQDGAVMEVFGEPGSSGRGGRMGRLLPRTLRCLVRPSAAAMPFADAGELGEGIFVAARTSVDAGTGAAMENHLYFEETLASGAEFAFSLLLTAKGGVLDAGDNGLALLLQSLGCLAAEGGQPMGRGGGRVRVLPDKLAVSGRSLGGDGRLSDAEDFTRLWKTYADTRLRPPVQSFPIHLACEGPFLVVDSSSKPQANRDDQVQVAPQRIEDRLPLLLESSMMGALRARSRWLWGLKELREGKASLQLVDIDRSAYGATAAPRIVRTASDARLLSSVERLFGVSGFAALVELARMRLAEPERIDEVDVTSVALDRFSGAPLDGALFETRAFINVVLDVELVLTSRGGEASPSPDDLGLFRFLADDVRRNGLTLGHGGAKGFGWFKVEETHASG